IMPRVPPAPPIFSTTSVWPSVRDIWSPTRRVTTSVGPPAANGTMTVIGLFGYWAAAGALCNESASRLPAIRRHMNAMVFLPSPRRRDDASVPHLRKSPGGAGLERGRPDHGSRRGLRRLHHDLRFRSRHHAGDFEWRHGGGRRCADVGIARPPAASPRSLQFEDIS